MARPLARRPGPAQTGLQQWIRPRLTELVDAAPEGDQWLHEIKFDGYRMHARLDRGAVRPLTRTGLDWTHKYPAVAAAVGSLDARQAYLDGELCGVRPDGITSFSMIQTASDSGNAAALVFFLFDLLYLDGEDVSARPLIERKARLAAFLSDATTPLHYSDHQIGHGRAFHEKACAMSLEGIVSKRADAPYAPGNRGLWIKVKCLHREEFVVIGWTDPEGSRPWLGALLLGYYDSGGRLVCAGRVGAGIKQAELERLWRRLQPLAVSEMPLAVPPPRSTRFGSPLVLSRVHWVRPELVAEVKYLNWTGDNLLRQVVYEGLREEKPAAEVRPDVPYPKARPDGHSRCRAEKPSQQTRLRSRAATRFPSCPPILGTAHANVPSRMLSMSGAPAQVFRALQRSSPASQVNVLISGAGIDGPTLAFWLRNYGFAPTLVENAPALRTSGYVIDFWGLGYDIAEKMGLLPDIARIGYPMQELRIVDDGGRRLSGFGVQVFHELTGGHYITLGRSELSKLIYDRISGSFEIIFGDSITGLREADGAVRVEFEHGGEGRSISSSAPMGFIPAFANSSLRPGHTF